MSRVKAFTVLEMLINIVIMAIIVSMVYYLYASFVQQVYAYQNTSEEERALQQFYVQMKTDFYRSEKIIEDTNGVLRVHFYDNSYIVYQPNTNSLIRKQGAVTTTLSTKALEVSTFEQALTKERLVHKILLKTSLFDEIVDFGITKVYPPNITMQF